MIEIYEFVIDDVNADKFWRHGLTPEEIASVLDGRYSVIRNRSSGRAPYIVIGRDLHGQCIAIPIEQTWSRGVWRPITAWRCKRSEERYAPRR
jgi:hypothetical protein